MFSKKLVVVVGGLRHSTLSLHSLMVKKHCCYNPRPPQAAPLCFVVVVVYLESVWNTLIFSSDWISWIISDPSPRHFELRAHATDAVSVALLLLLLLFIFGARGTVWQAGPNSVSQLAGRVAVGGEASGLFHTSMGAGATATCYNSERKPNQERS